MKKIIFILTCLITCIFACNYSHNKEKRKIKSFDSLQIVNIVKQVTNPEFYSVKDIINYKYQYSKDYIYDSIFSNISEHIFINAATVCINKYGKVSKSSIIQEYLSNKDVYDNLYNKQNTKPKIIEELFEQKDNKEQIIDSLKNNTTCQVLKNFGVL